LETECRRAERIFVRKYILFLALGIDILGDLAQ
jgi:hypothetical protein